MRLGGVDGLVAWVQKDDANEKVWWGTIYPKLLPIQVSGDGGGPVKVDHSGTVALEPSEAYRRLLNG